MRSFKAHIRSNVNRGQSLCQERKNNVVFRGQWQSAASQVPRGLQYDHEKSYPHEKHVQT
jgi:hypothetical protein